MERCSFCGKKKDEVEHLIQGGKHDGGSLPMVFICEQCIALCARIVGLTETKREPPPEKLTDWAHVDVDGETYRWSAVRTIVITEGFGKARRRELMVMMLVGKIGEAASGMMHPDGTEPTEALAVEAVRTLLLQGSSSQ